MTKAGNWKQKFIHTVWEVICFAIRILHPRRKVTKLSSNTGSAQRQNHPAYIATSRLLRYSRPAGRSCQYLTRVQ